ncbi:MAG: carbohydrate ABC transporter substrate-binding protein [Rubrivivax sp.]|nr:MAG: carbohydrate ABC transporter substrate-binding protein [Rubrivivax sp.]
MSNARMKAMLTPRRTPMPRLRGWKFILLPDMDCLRTQAEHARRDTTGMSSVCQEDEGFMKPRSRPGAKPSYFPRLLAASLLVAGLQAARAAPVEVLHWWTSAGEAAAVQTLRDGLQSRGWVWQDSGVAGGDDRKRLVAAARAGADALPDSVQLHTNSLRERAGLWLSLQPTAAQGGWDRAVPAAVRLSATLRGQWVAAPVNVHRTNWVWASKRLLSEAGITTPPATFEELVAAADKLAKLGHLPLAHGGEGWQDALLFDNAVLSVGGVAFYRQALIALDDAALRATTMHQAFEQLATLRRFMDPRRSGRPWNFATAMLTHDRAAMQVSGDWVKGEFVRAGKKAGTDILCFPYPGTQGSFVFVSDLFAMPRRDASRVPGQLALAQTLMDPAVQHRFNLAKGSIPARLDVQLDGYDTCAQQAARDYRSADERGTLVSRYTSEVPEAVRNAVAESVGGFMAGSATPAQGVAGLAAAIQAAKKSRPADQHRFQH